MEHRLDFERLVNYDAGESGITVSTILKFSDKSVSFPAKIDTGATFCILSAGAVKKLGLEIESGLFQRVGTATGIFDVFVFDYLCKWRNLNSIRWFISPPTRTLNVMCWGGAAGLN